MSSARAVALSFCIGVRGCGCPSLISVCRIETAVFALMNRAPNSASAADDMTAQIIWEMLRTAPLLIGISLCPAMNMWPPAWLRDLGSKRYDASLWIARIMSLDQKVSTASSCVAMKSKKPLHRTIDVSVGLACWDARELRGVSSPPSTPLARKKDKLRRPLG